MADISAGGLLFGEPENFQAVTAKALQELLDSFNLVVVESIERSFQKFGLKNNNGLPEGRQEETNQRIVILENKTKAVKMEMEVGIIEAEVLADTSTQITEKQESDLLMQADKLYGNNFWFDRQRNELFEHPSKKSQNGGLKPDKRILRRKRAFKIQQPHINMQKFSKVKAGGGAMLKKSRDKKNWKKYRKKEV